MKKELNKKQSYRQQRLSDTEERRERERLRRVQLGIEASQRRENDEWNPDDTDAQGLAANALKDWLIDEDEWEGATTSEIAQQIEDLRDEMGKRPRGYCKP